MIIIEALNNIRPGAKWVLENTNLTWLDTEQSEPTLQELNQEVSRLKLLYDTTEYQRQRAREYPPITDYLDGVVKGDQQQIQAYIDACLAVKTKFPKPE